MFKLHDEHAAISRIQTYLHFIRDRTYHSLPPLTPDGIYGDETRLAVSEFQEIVGLAKSGVVDRETNDALYLAYKQGIEVDVLSGFGNDDFPIRIGSVGVHVEILNSNLKILRGLYTDLPRADRGDYYGISTERTVIALEKIFGYEPSGTVNAALYNRIAREAGDVELIENIIS